MNDLSKLQKEAEQKALQFKKPFCVLSKNGKFEVKPVSFLSTPFGKGLYTDQHVIYRTK